MYGGACAGRPAAALDAVRNFTAAAALQALPQQPGPQQGPAGVLAGYAAHAAEHFVRARRACKKVRLPHTWFCWGHPAVPRPGCSFPCVPQACKP
jgi:hypothetical protein